MNRFTYFFILMLCLSPVFMRAQIVINEISSNNFSSFPDEDGDYNDWIELHNAGAAPVNLFNYKLTDNPALPNKWAFPSVTIPAGGYLTVYASDKNRLNVVDHWETVVKESDTWKYFVPSAAMPSDWNATTFNDAAWSSGPGGFGYGDADDGTTVPAGTVSVFTRRSFNIVDKSAISSMILHADYDDGFVAYLNGIEIARANISALGVPLYTALADTDREAVMYTGGNPQAFSIPKSIFEPLLINGTNVLSIQIHNKAAASSDLTLRAFLSVGINNPSFTYQTLPAWFVPPASAVYLHTNFAISASGETLRLYDAGGTLLNNIIVPAMQPDDTWGRDPNATGTPKLLQPATPNADNTPANAFTGYYPDQIVFSVPPGFYPTTQSVTMTCPNGASQIYYTTDGTKPTTASTLYTGPVSVPTTRVLRGACFGAGYITYKYETNTYFINDPGSTIPVISISTAPANFFSNATGIYVLGPGAEAAQPNFGANFWMDWEREIHIEYFDKTAVHRFEQDAGVKILGGWSRANSMKSLQIRAGDKYGKKKFSYNLFNEPKKTAHKEVETFTLRNGGNDFNITHLRDALNHRTLNSIPCIENHVDFEAYGPANVFINGQYWGVHTLRERIDDTYFENNFGYDQDDVDYCEFDGNPKKGTNTEFLQMINFVSGNDMTTAANYNTLKTMLDVENFVDYMAAEIYHTNWDWPHNNIKFWQPSAAGGKWRYIYHDTDFGHGLFGYSSPTSNELTRVIDDTRSVHSPFFKKLLTNTTFRNYFINRYADLMNTIYQPTNYKGVYDILKNEINPEMTRHFNRWNDNAGNVTGWNNNINSVKNFIDNRMGNVRNHIQARFGLVKQVNVTLQTSPAGAGKIKISTITPCSLPWTGVYFDGVPVTIEVIPNDGYTFSHWQSNTLIPSPNTNKTVTLNISSNDVFTAYFNTTTNIPKLIISELNYNSDTAAAKNIDAGDWIELYNSGNAPADISGWKLGDDKPYHNYVIPPGTIIAPGQYLVLVSDVTKFTARFPTVTNYVGPFNFGFDKGGETIRLNDQTNTTRLSVTYDDATPWPLLADGKGTTLERVMTSTNANDPASWFDGCRQGSPGRAYTPCPCQDVSLGPDVILCMSGGSKIVTTGFAVHPNRKFTWFQNGIQLGSTGPAINVTVPGTYSVLVDSMGCFKTDVIRVDADLTFDLGPAVSLCTPVVVTLDTRLPATGVTYVWTKNAATISGATSSSLTVNTPGTYAVTATATGCTAKNDNIVVSSASAVPVDAARCGAGVVNLSVTGSGTYEWYANPTGGSPITTGLTYSPNLSNTTTFYVKDASFFSRTVGPVDTSFGSTWWNNTWTYKLRFNVIKACILDYVTVYTDGPQNVTVRILASNGTTVLFTRTVPVFSAGRQRIPLGFNLSVGTGYYIDGVGTTGQLKMNNQNASYPYTDPGYMSITGGEPSWTSDAAHEWYMYFYNWEFSSGPGPCDRVPVTGTINCVVPVELVNLSVKRNTGTGTLVTWNTVSEHNSSHFGVERSLNGKDFENIGIVQASGGSSALRHYSFTDEVSGEGIIYYRLKITDKDNSFTYSEIVKIDGDGDSFMLHPNPSEDKFELFINSYEENTVTISVYDLAGRIVLRKDNYSTNRKIVFGEELPKGSYVLQVIYSDKLITSKLVKQ